MKRVAVIGNSCSGKSTFAQKLAQRVGAQHIELDALYWRENWAPAPQEEFKSAVSEIVQQERWILDGNYSAVRDIVWAQATTIIWLNYSFPLVFSRALRRTFGRVLLQTELWSGNRETFRQTFFSGNSILWWVCKMHRPKRREHSVLFENPPYKHLQLIVINSPREAEHFLSTYSSSGK
jgi:adenylate kinase family enzyme